MGQCGYPDRDGFVTLDASIMRGDGSCGAVAALEDIDHPISVARKVMEHTPHVMLVGAGARQFAVSEGFKPRSLRTPEAEKAWREWLKTAQYQPEINVERRRIPGSSENHDTIGMLAIGRDGRMAGACTTSGMAFKMRGRVGEEMIRNTASFLVVELMRQGHSPAEACRIAIERVVKKRPEASKTLQVCFLALNKHGEVGAFALHRGFVYAVCDSAQHNVLLDSPSVYSTTQT